MASSSRVGELLLGKYRLEQALGSGGVGEVYRAQNVLINRMVAIKTLRKERVSDEVVLGRFKQEARTANLIKHPNVVDVLDLGEDENGVPFIVQEFLEGIDLGHYMQQKGGPLDYRELLTYMIPIVDAVAVAHANGVIHRDLKPENVFLAQQNGKLVPKLLDFGISYVRQSQQFPPGKRLTRTGMTVGTPAYMAPEQVEGTSGIDPRTDIWALGVILYEGLSGRLPFDGETPAMLFAQIAWVDPIDLAKVAPQAPPDVCAVVMRCLHRDKEQRYPSAEALERDMKLVKEGLPLDFGDRPTGIPSTLHVQLPLDPHTPVRRAPSLHPPRTDHPPPLSDEDQLQDELLDPLESIESAQVPEIPQGPDSASGLELKTVPPVKGPDSSPRPSTETNRRTKPEHPPQAGTHGGSSSFDVERMEVSGMVRGMVLAAVVLTTVGLWHLVVGSDAPKLRHQIAHLSSAGAPGFSLLSTLTLGGLGGWLGITTLRARPVVWGLLAASVGLLGAAGAFLVTLTVVSENMVSVVIAVSTAVVGLGFSCYSYRRALMYWNHTTSAEGPWMAVSLAFIAGTSAFVGLLVFRSLI